ncbi:hypothetical protein [Hymenobacter volaticus]|uniref:hypothetical protein n=1 Tax=Hymenobacter volaticus TaxID=2932254 RepID=UPI001FD7064A|nr:hypothetical protein [Hymenobacter volaticus]
METNPVVTGAAFAALVGRLRGEQPASYVYLHTNIVTDRYFLLGKKSKCWPKPTTIRPPFTRWPFGLRWPRSRG